MLKTISGFNFRHFCTFFTNVAVFRPDALDIAYVGNYLPPYDKVTEKMDEAGKRLIKRLVEKNKIAADYVVVGQNQTEKTFSPGENVFKKLVSWPHYDSKLHFS